MKPQTIVSKLIKQLCRDIHEREQIMAVCLLGAIAGHNTFLFGPPGTAKSLISRRLAGAFESSEYFEYLMNRFSTPEEVFGPVSLKALKEDRYTRKVEGYLPTANFAFLDEIWKASPAILNNLLTIINEHIFKNGDERINVPLKSLIAASNEVPAKNQGLEALYDRFIIRLFVPPIQHDNHFKTLLDSQPTNEKTEIDAELRISQAQLEQWRKQLHQVRISEDTFQIIQYIRKELAKRFKELDVYVSDRRWQRAAVLLKASAFCNGRTETNHSDAVLLKYCLWTTPENREAIDNLVMQAVKKCGFQTNTNLAALDSEKNQLESEINKEFFYHQDIYETVILGDEQCFELEEELRGPYGYVHTHTFYIPEKHLHTDEKFHPIDMHGNIIREIIYQFNGQGSCEIYFQNRKNLDFTPNILFTKGSKKQGINPRLIAALHQSVSDMANKLKEVLTEVEAKYQHYQNHLSSPFITQADADVAVSGILEQINQLKLRIKDCERLEALCH